jgi:thioredoxin reductase (NADPH)
MEHTMEKVIIIGSGPAGHTAAIYAARSNLKPLLFEGFMAGGIAAGGQLTTTTEIENFPGFPELITGPELMFRMREQAVKCGTRVLTETVEKTDLSSRPFKVSTAGGSWETQTLIIATGAIARRMHVPNERHFWQRGISACALCDGGLPLFRNQPLAVIGGGDTAAEEASYLSKFGSKIYLIHRRDKLRASAAMQGRILKNPKIEMVWDTTLTDVEGENTIQGLILKNVKTSAEWKLAVKGLFYAIGHTPNTDFLQGQLELDSDNYIVTKPGSTKTSVEGVFAAGDVQDKKYRQAITSAGTGCMAALEAEAFLSE